jgi:uncharacterized YigZ family protein
MQYIKEHFTTTLEVKQSKFIAHLIPHNLYEETLKKLKDEHPKARHFVVAYRYLNEFNQIVEYSSDDGEPKGTSGKPSLMVLQGADIINTAVIIVRYFGGTKLGTGGLVRAYSDAVNLVLESAKLFTYVEKIQKTIEIAYADIRFIEYEASLFDVEIVEKRFENMCIYTIEATRNNVELFLSKVRRLIRLLA